MFRHTIPLGRIFGIRIDLDYSWFLIAGLITWLLAVGYYPTVFHASNPAMYWLLGAATAIMLFVSVLIHELGHSVVAKRFGLAVPRITLFIFGGVSQIADEPPSAGAEFAIAIVGPLVSLTLALIFRLLEPVMSFSPPLFALNKYLALINLLLGLFNLIPGFPLDGGRVFRGIIWKLTGNYQRATTVAALTGRFFGYFMIFLGVFWALQGNLLNGIWIAFIGWFLESAAGSEIQLETLKNLAGAHTVVDAMKRDVPRVSGSVSLQDLVDKYVLPRGASFIVVEDDGNPAGSVTLSAIRSVPRSAWATTKASQIMVPLQNQVTVAPDTRLFAALEKMGTTSAPQLPVVEGQHVVGVLSKEDILHYLSLLQAVAA